MQKKMTSQNAPQSMIIVLLEYLPEELIARGTTDPHQIVAISESFVVILHLFSLLLAS